MVYYGQSHRSKRMMIGGSPILGSPHIETQMKPNEGLGVDTTGDLWMALGSPHAS